MFVWYAGAAISGALLGALFSLIFRKIVPPRSTRNYWKGMGQGIHGLLMGDEREFWHFYGGIIRSTGRYVGRQMAGLLAALLPLSAFALLLWPHLKPAWLAPSLSLTPVWVFFISLSVFSILFFLRGKKAVPAETEGYDIGGLDYVLTLIATRYARLLRALGDWETRLARRKLASIAIESPIFVTGLARAGTTILLETLAHARGIATHRYRDFPFIMTPIGWNRFISSFSAEQKPVERPHQDRIKISRESPDAFEEPIWQHFFPHLHDPKFRHSLDARTDHPQFAAFYRDHLKKILLIRNGTRYLSKGNYNVSRIAYLAALFPDARFVIPIRHPLRHVESLVRQHRLFTAYATKNPQVAEYLKAVGHYEFGPQREPICLTDDGARRILDAWETGHDALGYAIQWAEIYGYVHTLQVQNPHLAGQIAIVRYEDLCENPKDELQRILKFVSLENAASATDAAKRISPPSRPLTLSQAEQETCWAAVRGIAEAYGYVENKPLTHREKTE